MTYRPQTMDRHASGAYVSCYLRARDLSRKISDHRARNLEHYTLSTQTNQAAISSNKICSQQPAPQCLNMHLESSIPCASGVSARQSLIYRADQAPNHLQYFVLKGGLCEEQKKAFLNLVGTPSCPYRGVGITAKFSRVP